MTVNDVDQLNLIEPVRRAIRVAINDANTQIKNGSLSKLSEDNPDDHENFYTLSLLYSDDDDIDNSIQADVQEIIFNHLVKEFPEYS